MDLTDADKELIHFLPADGDELSDKLNIGKSAVRDRISRIREKGVTLPYNRQKQVYYLADEGKTRRVSTKNTGSKTREANDFITEIEKAVLRRLSNADDLIQPQNPTPGHEDLVLHFTDLHIGDVVEDQNGRVIYDTETAKDVVEKVTRQTLKLKATMGDVAEYDTLHVLYGGDMITNENIYDGQAFDIERMLADQMSVAVNALTSQLKSFANSFESVNVVCQPGNHGKTRASGVSKQANMDLVTYRWIQDRLTEFGVSNIDFSISESTFYQTFKLRGGKWTGFLTHGQDSLQHVDSTGASSRDWRGWLNQFGFDVGYRGHYHESRRENVQNGPFVFESPSPKPSGEFADKIGQGSVKSQLKRLATVHGSSDKRPVTWECVLDDLE